MAEKTLIAKIQADADEADMVLVTSPVVGMADGAPKRGVFLNPLDRVITMKVLNQRFVLRLPRDVHGRVVEVFIPNAYTPVAFGQPIARLDPRVREAEAGGAGGADGGGARSAEAEQAGLITIPAPTEGVFYRRPSPDEPPYVEVGTEVTTGSVLGLVEIMKCFYQITYGAPGFPEKGEVVAILVDDTTEVHFDQPLFRVKPSS